MEQMNKAQQNEPRTRAQIKERFKNGKLPTEEDFKDLIDSMVNIKEDGFTKTNKEGLKIYSVEDTNSFLTFYNHTDKINSFLTVRSDGGNAHPSLKFTAGEMHIKNAGGRGENMETGADDNSFFFHLDGKMGIGKECDPAYKMEVDGMVGMKGRIGTYEQGSVPADRKWHPIIKGLKHCQAFEVMARTGRAGSGKFAMLHAIAISTYGNSKNKIRKTSAYYGLFWNKINLRWVGTTHDYTLEMRTNSNYTDRNGEVKIFYTVTKLWDDEQIVPAEYRMEYKDK